MRRITQLSMLCLAAGAVSACTPEALVKSEDIPTAGVRFINAVPDTGAAYGLDLRFVDLVENSSAYRITFRNGPTTTSGVTGAALVQYKNAQAGSRHFKIFLDDTLQNIASVALKDSTVNLEAGHNYTFLLWGNARSAGPDKMRLTIIDETVADPGGQVALRVINATANGIDVRQYVATGTVPATATWANVAGYTISNYVTAPPSQIRYNVRPSGSATTLFADMLALIGQPAGTATAGCVVGVDCEALPGTTVPGSAITLIVFPPSVTGSKAASFTTAGGAFIWDRRPNRACSSPTGC
jgi:hypothetical protein